MNPSRSSPTRNVFDQPLVGQTLYNNGVSVQSYPFPMSAGYSNPPLFGSFNAGPSYSPPRSNQRTSVGPTARSARANTVRGPYARHREPVPGGRARDPRPPPQAPSQAREQTYPGFEQPPWISFPGPSRRSDRSTSPRASNRRNFERYSVDLSQSSTSSDAEEAAARAPPSNRMRHRPREVLPRPPGRQTFSDPNVSTARQINILKLSLNRHLPSALPEDASKTCDICQKDYATTLVAPTEDEENAVQLVCGHRFGEFCINQWFDTCREHKNKVTCPMCRAQLIEEPRWIPPLLHASSRGQAFIELLAREQELLARAEMQAQEFQSHFYQT
ncbi:zinc ion binding protein [Alternaria alternata]|nr:zinc ion binding protein [Alternaria alternata]